MKKILLLFLLLCLSFLDSFGQEHYYWAYGKKHPMQIFPEKYFVLVDSKQSKNGLLSVLGGDATGISEMANVEITSIIRRNLKDRTVHEELSWAIVEGRFGQSVENHEEILYASPFFTVNGKEIGLSHFFSLN